MIIAGIDNGVTGSIGVLGGHFREFWRTPKFKHQKYTKKKAFVNRINGDMLSVIMLDPGVTLAIIERPMVNPQRFQASTSALRALEATLIVLERLEIEYEFCDSKEWQHALLPGIKGSEFLKKASMELGIKLYPEHEELIRKQKDADGLLIAHWYKEYKLKE